MCGIINCTVIDVESSYLLCRDDLTSTDIVVCAGCTGRFGIGDRLTVSYNRRQSSANLDYPQVSGTRILRRCCG